MFCILSLPTTGYGSSVRQAFNPHYSKKNKSKFPHLSPPIHGLLFDAATLWKGEWGPWHIFNLPLSSPLQKQTFKALLNVTSHGLFQSSFFLPFGCVNGHYFPELFSVSNSLHFPWFTLLWVILPCGLYITLVSNLKYILSWAKGITIVPTTQVKEGTHEVSHLSLLLPVGKPC